MVNIKELVDIKEFSTFKIESKARYFYEASSIDEIIDCINFAEEKGVGIIVIGGGSNVIFSKDVIDSFILKINLKLFNILKEDDNYVYIESGAGEILDDFILKTIEMDLSGLESLSGIPGTVGATPVQNVGAYGGEVSSVIDSVKVLDRKTKETKIFKNNECGFKYRDSIFKSSLKNKYIITSVIFKLAKTKTGIPNYKDVMDYFLEKKIDNPSKEEIREAIIYIRSKKLPDWKIYPNVGSFFENPIVSLEILNKIKIDFPDVKFFKIDDNNFKIPAGWLIDKASLKGKNFGKISVYEKNALVLVNNGGATIQDLILAKDKIIKIVGEKFGIVLEQEPEMI